MKQKQEAMEAQKNALAEKSEALRQELNEKAKALGLAQDQQLKQAESTLMEAKHNAQDAMEQEKLRAEGVLHTA